MIRQLLLTIGLIMLVCLAGCRKESGKMDMYSSTESDITSFYENKDEICSESPTENMTHSSSVFEASYNSSEDGKIFSGKTKNISSISAQSEEETSNNNISSETIQDASALDSEKIAELIVNAINSYRNKDGIKSVEISAGLTEYAKYRSRQLISNFSHDTFDERAAATALKYGRYIDPLLYGMVGEPYYTACTGEAIVKAGYAGKCEYISESIARLVFTSSDHWNYIGNANNKYIGVGVAYDSGLWYCDIAVSDMNYDE